MSNKYYEQAQNQYLPSYNQQVQSMANQLAQNQQALEQSKGGINTNYDKAVGNQNLNNKKAKNNMSNSMLGRGLGASSIATTGLAEADQINNRAVGDINDRRTMDLNNIDQQKAMLAQSHNSKLSQMEADKERAIWALANQLEDRDFDKNFKQQQLAQQKALQEAQLAFQREQMGQQMALQREKMGWEREQYNMRMSQEKAKQDMMKQRKIDDMLDSFVGSTYSMINNPNGTSAEKYDSHRNMNDMMNYYGNKYGIDTSSTSNTMNEMMRKYAQSQIPGGYGPNPYR